MRTVFLRALEAEDKGAALRLAIRDPEAARGKQRFEADVRGFAAVPGSPFAYWVSDAFRKLFTELPPFEDDSRTARQGLATANDFRFVRASWEVSARRMGKRWFPFAKGGQFSPFYADVHLAVNWEAEGAEVKSYIVARYPYLNGNAGFVAKNTDFYFRPGLTWPIKNRFSLKPRVLPAASVFAHIGPSAFVQSDSAEELAALQAVMSSITFTALVRTMAGWNFEVGLIQDTPVPRLSATDVVDLAALAHRAWSLKRWRDTANEHSHAFTRPALLQVSGDTLSARAEAWARDEKAAQAELATIQTEIDTRSFDLYGLSEEDRRVVADGFGTPGDVSGPAGPDDPEADDEDEPQASADAEDLTKELLAWAVGTAFGRFDVRVGTGAATSTHEQQPFDPLPFCSPAELVGDGGLPPDGVPTDYSLTFPMTGILVDDPGHVHDLTAAVRTVFDCVGGEDSDGWWDEAAALVDPKDHDIRAWLATSFFAHHLKGYSKSRRKAPILWHLSTPSGRYGVWLYAHRLTRDSFFQLHNDIVVPKLAHEERQLANLAQGAAASAKERKQIAAQEAFVEELRALVDEVKRVTPLWDPTLDDGAVLTMSLLWRLVPQHKAWQKELKSKWDEVAGGKYDWAHLAMHLWPERVVPKCAADRSLALAHGLDAVFWVEGTDGKWTARTSPTRTIGELVRERSSPAVKEALRSMLEAPTAGAGNGRGPRGRAATVGGTR